MDILNLGVVDGFVFCFPSPNVSIEQMFSLMTSTWTDVRNHMDNAIVESCLVT